MNIKGFLYDLDDTLISRDNAFLGFTKKFYESFIDASDFSYDEFLKIIRSADKKTKWSTEKKLLFDDISDQVSIDTANAWTKYNSSKSILDVTTAQLKAAEIANEGITLEYDSSNTRTTLEVIQSRSLLLDARIAFARAERDFMISQVELAFQLGTLSLNTIKPL